MTMNNKQREDYFLENVKNLPSVERLAHVYNKTLDEVINALRPYLIIKYDKNKVLKECRLNFTDKVSKVEVEYDLEFDL